MPMTQEHKEALARGRRESRMIKAYLEALESRRPGRRATPESLKQRLANLEEKIATEQDPLKKVDLLQAKLDTERQLEEAAQAANFEELERGFIEVAKSYSERKGISYKAWREAGVPPAVLKKAGIPRTRG
ncbi:MAG: hypothetical protein KatS3mg011_1429 [Acidimicrobiia bacterium]|nr:MAG: hypothetical protein KatS3mg011_1429 [Acidimicrobiia bacterium]